MNRNGIARKVVLIIALTLLGLILAGISTFFIIYRNEIRTVASLNTIDEYGMYDMTYHGNYGLDELLETGAKDGSQISNFIIKNLTHWYSPNQDIKVSLTEGGCTAFAVQNDKNEYIYGRNFDFSYSPSLVLHTNPKNDYASVSTVNLACLGFGPTKLPKSVNDDNFNLMDSCLLLAAPFIPFDGMNEKGVAISLLALPESQAPYSEDKVTLNTTVAIRLVLDKAASVEEAVALLSKYNIYFSKEAPCHYFIADASGTSIIVEFIDGEMKLVYPDAKYQIASNFIACDDSKKGYGVDRYEFVKNKIESCKSILPDSTALELLSHVGIRENGIDRLQWSVLYNMTNLTGEIFAHKKFKDRSFFAINN